MDKVILAFYMNVGGMSNEDVPILIEKFKEELQNDDLIQYFIPIIEGESRVECVYPRYIVSEEAKSDIDKAISRLNNHIKKFEDNE